MVYIVSASYNLRKPDDGLSWPSSDLQRLVLIKVHSVAVPKGSHGLHYLCVVGGYLPAYEDGMLGNYPEESIQYSGLVIESTEWS